MITKVEEGKRYIYFKKEVVDSNQPRLSDVILDKASGWAASNSTKEEVMKRFN